MQDCPQTPTQSVLEHGESVHSWFNKLVQKDIPHQLPDWVITYERQLNEALARYDTDTIKDYHVMHDCGKPLVRHVDSNGRQHFPNHAEASYNCYKLVSNNKLAAHWIRHDMDVHTIKATDVPGFCKLEGWEILLLTGLAELYANAEMFGGTEATSFKIKYKQLLKRGRAACKHAWGGHMAEHSYDPNWKMRVVVDGTLHPGAQLAQSLHAITEFLMGYPEQSQEWYQLSNSVVVMNAQPEQLQELIERCEKKQVRYSVFHEPDMDNRLTAVAVEPTRDGKRVTSNYPLALKHASPS